MKLHFLSSVTFAFALIVNGAMADVTPTSGSAGQDLDGAGQAIETAAIDVGHATEVVADKTVLVAETVGQDSYRYFFLPAGKDIEAGSKIVATDVKIASVDTAKITIKTAEQTYYFVGDVSEDAYHDAVLPGLHFVVVGAEDVEHGIVVGAEAVGHGFAVAGRAIGHFFGIGNSDPAQQPSSTNTVLDTGNGTEVVESIQITAPSAQ